ncbi:hypothetical protein AB3X91_32035 [Paraburkholderia sp. BR14263]|uniref:hypothetical protein n=1 Tax=unclassified Paraburkholderia TaxID=2615204 RepID=UPI0034CD6EDE
MDIAVRLGKPPFAKGLVSDPLFPLQVFGVASPQLLKPDHPVHTISDLQNYVLLHDCHDLWPEYFNALGCTNDVGELKGRTSVNRRSPSMSPLRGRALHSRANISSSAI